MRRLVFLVLLLTILNGSYRGVRADDVHGMGYIPTPEAELNALIKDEKYRGFLPPAADLSRDFPEPGDQGELGSCVAWAVGYAARGYYAAVKEGRDVRDNGNLPSPSFIYHNIRKHKNCEGGSEFLDAFRLLKGGALSLASYPYVDRCIRIDPAIRNGANDFKIRDFSAIKVRIDDIKAHIARRDPVVFGMLVADDFNLLRGNSVYMGPPNASDIGGHAMVVVGYDDTRQAFKVINSWGRDWGDNGFGWIDYDTFKKSVREAYVMKVRGVSPSPTPPVQPPPTPPDPGPPPDPAVVEVPGLEGDCSKLRIVTSDDVRRLTGFVGSQDVLERISAQFPPDKFKNEVEVKAWPQCEVLLTLDRELESRDPPSVELGKRDFLSGETLKIDVRSPKSPSYIYISYIQADGSVVNLQQPSLPALSPSQSGRSYIYGDGQEGRSTFKVSAPFGKEMIIALASASPLFDAALPQQQTEREYLSALRRALTYKVDPKLGRRIVSAAVADIETAEKPK